MTPPAGVATPAFLFGRKRVLANSFRAAVVPSCQTLPHRTTPAGVRVFFIPVHMRAEKGVKQYPPRGCAAGLAASAPCRLDRWLPCAARWLDREAPSFFFFALDGLFLRDHELAGG